MAEQRDDAERTEDPTQKRLDDAHERGDVAKSQEVNTWFVVAAGTLILLVFSGRMSRDLTATFQGVLANAHAIRADGYGLRGLVDQLAVEVIAAVAIPFLVLLVAAVLGNVIQHRFVWSAEQLKPKLSKISLIAGAKRLFSKQALANFAKGLAKIVVIGAVMTVLLWPESRRLDSFIALDPFALLAVTQSLSLQAMGGVVALLAIIAGADFLFQYRQWYQRQRMSVVEIKDEFKQTEGDPMIKGRIRQLRVARMRKRMMANLPTASVVITNPTHFAVALRYEAGMSAPVCVAKGVDALARRIREVAEGHGIPIVENPPLARTLHAAVDIDEEVPPEHYKAVAEVIGYVMRLRRAVGR